MKATADQSAVNQGLPTLGGEAMGAECTDVLYLLHFVTFCYICMFATCKVEPRKVKSSKSLRALGVGFILSAIQLSSNVLPAFSAFSNPTSHLNLIHHKY